MSIDEEVCKSTCRIDYGGCGALVYVKNGKVMRLEGDPECPTNKGRLCPKGRSSIEFVYHPDRLKYPMKRVGKRGEGKWQRITWDEGLDIISSKLNACMQRFKTNFPAIEDVI